MKNRTNKDVEEIMDFILDRFDLSVPEEDLVDSFLEILRERNVEKQKQLSHLLYEETEELLELLNGYEIQRFAERHFDMVAECDECEELKDYDDDDLLDEVESRDLNWQDYDSDIDIVTQSQLE